MANQNVPKAERQKLILKQVDREGHVSLADLQKSFSVSAITLRRDLNDLAEQGLLQRTHGGAMAFEQDVVEPPVISRISENRDLKEAIGKAAAGLVQDGESIFLSSGSTTYYVARHLNTHKDLTVVTNALNTATTLAGFDDITVVVIGGMLRPSELSLIGHIAEQALREVHVDKVIMGIPAISLRNGLSNNYLPEVMTDRTIISMAEELIIVADHTKFEKTGSAYLAPLERVTTLVTDFRADPEFCDQISDMGVEVLIAGQDM